MQNLPVPRRKSVVFVFREQFFFLSVFNFKIKYANAGASNVHVTLTRMDLSRPKSDDDGRRTENNINGHSIFNRMLKICVICILAARHTHFDERNSIRLSHGCQSQIMRNTTMRGRMQWWARGASDSRPKALHLFGNHAKYETLVTTVDFFAIIWNLDVFFPHLSVRMLISVYFRGKFAEEWFHTCVPRDSLDIFGIHLWSFIANFAYLLILIDKYWHFWATITNNISKHIAQC